ncbi:cytochrome oxidase complex assembly protein 1-domain-containing protein [Mycena crocata]|nr:cytochrome oxidase complex assembly protein 1-domain-containing protein [Mycena crocata]
MASRLVTRRAVGPKSFSTMLPRPPPTEPPPVTTFSAPSRPKPVFRPPRNDLPPHRRTWPIGLAIAALSVGSWAAFFGYVTNETKATSSVVQQILRTTAVDPTLHKVLGDGVSAQPEWWLNGKPRIRGELNQIQGNIDLSMRLRGSQCAGTLYFTSVRKAHGMPYEILRFKVIADDGTVVQVDPAAADT